MENQIRQTVSSINKKIKVDFPQYDIHMFKGRGYFYFIDYSDKGLLVRSIYHNSLQNLSYEEIKSNITDCINETENFGRTLNY